MIAPPGRSPFQEAIQPKRERVLAEVKRRPVNGVYRGKFQLRGRVPADDSRFGRVCMNEVRPKLAQHSEKIAIASPVVPRVNAATHRVELDHAKTRCPGAIDQAAFRADRRAGDERHFVAVLAMLLLARQQRVLLSSANDQTRDDMSNVHSRFVTLSRSRRSKWRGCQFPSVARECVDGLM